HVRLDHRICAVKKLEGEYELRGERIRFGACPSGKSIGEPWRGCIVLIQSSGCRSVDATAGEGFEEHPAIAICCCIAATLRIWRIKEIVGCDRSRRWSSPWFRRHLVFVRTGDRSGTDVLPVVRLRQEEARHDFDCVCAIQIPVR